MSHNEQLKRQRIARQEKVKPEKAEAQERETVDFNNEILELEGSIIPEDPPATEN